MRYLPDSNLAYPVLLEIGNTSGSGFYFRTNSKLFLVTAKHVLYKKINNIELLRNGQIKLTSYDRDLTVQSPILLFINLSQVNIRKNDVVDIALIELGNITDTNPGDFKIALLNGVTTNATTTSHIMVVPTLLLKSYDDVLISNEVFILGYPVSLGKLDQNQIELKKPLLRKGIIAGKNLSNKTIILDCPVYFGNSGGIAIEVEQINYNLKSFKVIGIVSQYIPFIEELRSQQLGYTNVNYENSGYSVVVPIDTINELTREIPTVTQVQG